MRTGKEETRAAGGGLPDNECPDGGVTPGNHDAIARLQLPAVGFTQLAEARFVQELPSMRYGVVWSWGVVEVAE